MAYSSSINPNVVIVGKRKKHPGIIKSEKLAKKYGVKTKKY